ncbi:MAG: S8 family serine peptidase [Calditrichaeota bacterium]|nr:S8 family serine peptidase [Calditrichota bacterium]
MKFNRICYILISLNLIVPSLILGSEIPDFTSEQTYLGPPPYGMNAQYAWQFQGGRGDGVKIVLIEGSGGNHDHRDLSGKVSGAYSQFGHHATSTAGIMVAQDNGFGITGLASNAQVHIIAAGQDDDLTSEIYAAKTWLLSNGGGPGDIIVIEIQVSGNHNNTPYNEMPAEFLPCDYPSNVYNRDAIKTAVDEGFVVIEVAGNGDTFLDPL